VFVDATTREREAGGAVRLRSPFSAICAQTGKAAFSGGAAPGNNKKPRAH
jgi:hypothetical protein